MQHCLRQVRAKPATLHMSPYERFSSRRHRMQQPPSDATAAASDATAAIGCREYQLPWSVGVDSIALERRGNRLVYAALSDEAMWAIRTEVGRSAGRSVGGVRPIGLAYVTHSYPLYLLHLRPSSTC